MKKLVLIRHAKSAWDDPFLSDHQRPLAERGLRDAPRMAQRLKKRGVMPEAMISSDAERAKTTALITAEQLKFQKEKIQLTPDLYHSSASEILRVIQQCNDSIETLFVFGHNPGFNDFIDKMGFEIDNLPTSGQFGIEFEVDFWSEISAKNANKCFFDCPKKEK
jgi:phosphohistidine phosphatase